MSNLVVLLFNRVVLFEGHRKDKLATLLILRVVNEVTAKNFSHLFADIKADSVPTHIFESAGLTLCLKIHFE
jgi:hypothetical protein